MNTKLTLTIEDSLIKEAKQYAKEQGRSLSDIVEAYFQTITKETEVTHQISPIASSLKGSFSAPENFDYKKELSQRLEEKYLNS